MTGRANGAFGYTAFVIDAYAGLLPGQECLAVAERIMLRGKRYGLAAALDGCRWSRGCSRGTAVITRCVRVSRPVIGRDLRPWVPTSTQRCRGPVASKGTCATTAGAGRCLCCATTSRSTSVPPTSVGRPCARSTAATWAVHATCWPRWRLNWPRTGRVRKPACSGSWRGRSCSPNTSLR